MVPANGDAHCRQKGGSMILAEETQARQTTPGSVSVSGSEQIRQLRG